MTKSNGGMVTCGGTDKSDGIDTHMSNVHADPNAFNWQVVCVSACVCAFVCVLLHIHVCVSV